MGILNQLLSPGREMDRRLIQITLISITGLVLLACGLPGLSSGLFFQPSPTQTALPSATVTSTMTPSLTPTITPSPSHTPTPTFTPTETSTPTPTITPTYAILRGEVNEEHVMCFYGPSKAYLYKYGLLGGNRLEIIGYMADTGYIEIRAIGGTNPCWMNLKFMDVQGDINAVLPVDPHTIKLPRSTFYNALDYVNANRNGNEVTISWSPLVLRAGDDSEQEPYLVETWVCQNGRLVFTPLGVYETWVTVTDEPGCAESSYGRVYGVEKHGYTPYLKISWPPFEN